MSDTTGMDEATLAGIEQRANAATEGPWTTGVRVWNTDRRVYLGERKTRGLTEYIDLYEVADAEFIAHARTDVEVMARAVRDGWERERRLSAALADLRAKVAAIIVECNAADSPLRDDVEAELSVFGDDTYDEVLDAKRDAAARICTHFAAALAAAPSGEQRKEGQR